MQIPRNTPGYGTRLDPQTMIMLQMIAKQRAQQSQGKQNIKRPMKQLYEGTMDLAGFGSAGDVINSTIGSGPGDYVNQVISNLGFPETGASWGGKLGGGQVIGGAPTTGPADLGSILGPKLPAPTVPSQASTGFLANAGGMSGSAAGAGALGGILGGVALGAKGAKDLLNGKKTKGWEGWGGRATLGIATGGISEGLRLAGLGRKTTKDYQKERRDKVIEDGNTGWANYFGGNPLGNDKVTPEGITRNENGNWVRADGSWDPREYAGVQGNADTFGDSWFGLDENTRNNVVQQIQDEGLYNKDKGNVLISGDDRKARAREIFNQHINNQPSQGLLPQSFNKPNTGNLGIDMSQAQSLYKPQAFGQSNGMMGNREIDFTPGNQDYLNKIKQQAASFNQWNPDAQVTSGSSFDPNSKQYNNLSKSQKDAYWSLRNSGR